MTNGHKHLKRDRAANQDAAAHVSLAPGFQLAADRLDSAHLGGFVIAGWRTWEDALRVADRCVVEWEGLLQKHGLAVP